MKKVLYILIVVLVASCNQTKNSKVNNQSADSLTNGKDKTNPGQVVQTSDTLLIDGNSYFLNPIDESWFKSIKHKPEKATPDEAIIISPDSIIIKCIANQVVLKNDTSDGDSMVRYEYLATLPEIGYVHVKAWCWEWTEDFFVNLKNGRQFYFWSDPIVSPNNKLIVSYCMDMDAQFMPNGLQLFKIEGDSIVKIFERKISDWGPEEVKWESDSSIVIKRGIPDDNMNYVLDFVRMSL